MKKYNSDFEIGNATHEEIARLKIREVYEQLEKNISEKKKKSIEKELEEELEEHLREVAYGDHFGMGYKDLWSVGIDGTAKDTYSFFKDFIRPKQPFYKSFLNAIRYGFKPKKRFEDMEKDGFKIADIFTECLNLIITEELGHASSDFSHEGRNKSKDYRFFLDFVDMKTDPKCTIDID